MRMKCIYAKVYICSLPVNVTKVSPFKVNNLNINLTEECLLFCCKKSTCFVFFLSTVLAFLTTCKSRKCALIVKEQNAH